MDVLLAIVGALAVLHVAYAMWTARRLDRLHRRVDAARAALDQQLTRRAEVAAEFAGRGRTASARELADVAAAARAVSGLGHDREIAENALSRALQAVADEADTALTNATMRAAFARRFHNDTVRDVLVVRRRRIVRYFHLAGSARMPSYFEMDDTALDRRTIEV